MTIGSNQPIAANGIRELTILVKTCLVCAWFSKKGMGFLWVSLLNSSYSLGEQTLNSSLYSDQEWEDE